MDFLKLIKLIDENRLMFFTTLELAELLGVETKSIQNYLETLANNELIIRVEKGKYCRTFLRDKYVIGSNLVQGGVVSHKSALQYYGLSEEDSDQVYISSDHQKNNKTLFNYTYNFIKIRPHKYFGFIETSGNSGSFRVTDLEKTVVDCFDLPQYTKSFDHIVQVFKSEHLKKDKLVEYGFRMNNLAVLKRMAYLSDIHDLPGYKGFQSRVKESLNEKYALLNPLGPDTGSFISKWKIRDNLDLS